MAAGLGLAGAALLAVMRAQFEVEPDDLIRGRSTAWLLLALALVIPLAAELFGASRRAVSAPALQPLPARRSQVLMAKFTAIVCYIAAAWCVLGATDLVLELFYPRTKIAPSHQYMMATLLFGTVFLALLVTGLCAATIRNALGSTMLGLITLLLVGAPVLGYMNEANGVGALGAIALSAAAFAAHPIVLGLALASLVWASAFRGRAAGHSVGATLRRSIAVLCLCGAAPAAALAASAATTLRSAPMAFDDPEARVYRAIPSPDASQLAINLFGPYGSGRSTGWIIDVESGVASQAITPRETARQVPLGAGHNSVTGWSPSGEELSLDFGRTFPWLDPRGAVDLQERSIHLGDVAAWNYVELGRWQHLGYDGYARAKARFAAASESEAVAALIRLAPTHLLVPRRAPDVAFGFSKGKMLHRIDGATGSVTVLDSVPISNSGDYRVDPMGVWVVSHGSPRTSPPALVNSVTGKAMVVPDGWEPSRSSFQDMIVRGDAVLLSLYRKGAGGDENEWAWLQGGVLGAALRNVDAYAMVDLDGDRLVAVSAAHRTIQLLDRRGKLIRTLRAPGEGE
jgi:hypothetical protein